MATLTGTMTFHVQTIASRGYPGIHKLRASCLHPLLHRLAYATGLPVKQVQSEWKVLPPRIFWPTIREAARKEKEPNWRAFIRLANTPVDPTLPCPHPLLCPR